MSPKGASEIERETENGQLSLDGVKKSWINAAAK